MSRALISNPDPIFVIGGAGGGNLRKTLGVEESG